MRRDRAAGLKHIREVRFTIFAQRCWHTNDHRLRLSDPAKLRGGEEFAGPDRLGNGRWLNVLYIAVPVIKQVNFLGVSI